MTLLEKYHQLKRRARYAMINGQLNYYMRLLVEVEQLSVVLIKNKVR